MSGCWQGAALRSCSGYATHLYLGTGIGGIISEIHSRKLKFGYGKLGWRGAYLVSRLHVGFAPAAQRQDALLDYLNEAKGASPGMAE